MSRHVSQNKRKVLNDFFNVKKPGRVFVLKVWRIEPVSPPMTVVGKKKRCQGNGRTMSPNKRARSDHNSNDPSLGPALGSGACRSPFAHSDPAVLAAIAAIEDPFVRRYAEQRCTEAALQRLLRENPA